MTPSTPSRSIRLLVVALVPVALLLSACGGDDSRTTTTSASAESSDRGTDSAVDDEVIKAWARKASEFRGRNGDLIDVECPAGGNPSSVWGSNIYTDDSSICTAAVHIGLIEADDGGEVTIEILGAEQEYVGSESNEVVSADYGPWDGSFTFPDAEPLEVSLTIGKDRAANFYKNRDTTTFTVECEGGGRAESVWGTGVYTEDSSICTAAAHAGLVSLADGGEVTFQLTAGQDSYSGTEANGVTSKDYGSYGGSFTFVRE